MRIDTNPTVEPAGSTLDDIVQDAIKDIEGWRSMGESWTEIARRCFDQDTGQAPFYTAALALHIGLSWAARRKVLREVLRLSHGHYFGGAS